MIAAIVVPARLASQRLPGKLLLNQTGRTLLEHTLECALAARARHPRQFQTILVACDDPRLAEAAARAGVAAVMTRPDHPSGTDRIAEAAQKLTEELVVNLQADEPEADPEDLARVAELLAASPPEVSVATLAAPITTESVWRQPNVVKVVVNAQGRALYFSRAPIPFARDAAGAPAWTVTMPDGVTRRVYGLHHLGIYAYRRAFLAAYHALPPAALEQLEKLEQLRVLEAGHAIRVGIVESSPAGIDTPREYEAFVARWKAGRAAGAGGGH